MSPDVAAAASRIASAGRAAWPDVKVSETTIANRLAQRLQDDPEARLESLHDADLYLAMALAESDPAALKVFEAELVPQHIHQVGGIAAIEHAEARVEPYGGGMTANQPIGYGVEGAGPGKADGMGFRVPGSGSSFRARTRI